MAWSRRVQWLNPEPTITVQQKRISIHFVLGYRVFYVINWVYRYYVEGRKNWISWIAGGVQTLLYTDFFYHYFRIIFQRRETII